MLVSSQIGNARTGNPELLAPQDDLFGQSRRWGRKRVEQRESMGFGAGSTVWEPHGGIPFRFQGFMKQTMVKLCVHYGDGLEGVAL